MPKEKEVTRLLPKIYKWNFENICLFIWVQAQQSVLPTITLDQCLKNYARHMKFTPDDWDFCSMRSTYTRLQKEFYDDLKSENTKNDKRTAAT